MSYRNSILTICLVLVLASVLDGQNKNRSVILPEASAQQIADLCSRSGPEFDDTWRPTEANIQTMESHLSRVSRLRSQSGILGVSIRHPERYYRQYIGIMVGKRKLIFINAFCDERPPSYWRERLVNKCDGGRCSWGVIYDIGTGKFSDLEMNGVG